MHLLVIEDERALCETIVRSLRRLAYSVDYCYDGEKALALLGVERYDLVLLDLNLPKKDGMTVLRTLRQTDRETRVLILSGHDESAIVYSALEVGAAGFLPKESSRAQIVLAVRDCAKGRDVLPPELAAGLVSEVRRRKEGPALSDRESEVLDGIARGRSVPTIAEDLFLAPSTVKTHVQRLYEKLGVTDRAAAVAEAMRRGILR